MNTTSERGLTGKELTLIKKVFDEPGLGEIPSASLEIVLRKGPQAKRFESVSRRQVARICELASQLGVELPTKEA